jgi:hypothetical protein
MQLMFQCIDGNGHCRFGSISMVVFVPYTEIFKHDNAFDFCLLVICGMHLISCCIGQIPLCHIPEPVIKTAGDWISQRSSSALGDFVLWCIDSIMSELSGPAAGTKSNSLQGLR